MRKGEPSRAGGLSGNVLSVSRGFPTGVAVLLTAAATAAPAAAQEPVGPYDGSIPFRCQLQDVGTGTDFPDPDADPFCVEFDKTQQNVADLGIADFLLNEPNRVAAASTKCFYFQRDHWTGSLVQGQPPELWNWEGNYWFDRARGLGGVSVREFRVAGVAADMTPFVPAAYQPFFDPEGGGGVQVTLATNPDPICGARVDTPEEREQVYPDAPRTNGCVPPGGRLRGRRVGRVKLGMQLTRVRTLLGPPAKRKRGVHRWCLIGAADLRIAFRRHKAALIRTSSRGHDLRGIATGNRSRKALRRLGPVEFELGRTGVIAAGSRPRRHAFAAVRAGRVRWLALSDPGLIKGSAERALRRTR